MLQSKKTFMYVNCPKSYTTKKNLEKHYGYEKVKVDGKLVKIKCFIAKAGFMDHQKKRKIV